MPTNSADTTSDKPLLTKSIPDHNLFDYLFFLRPILHPPVWTIVILGYYRAPGIVVEKPILFWLLLISSGAAGWAYIINQIADIESDRINGKLHFLPDNLIPVKMAFIIAGVIFVFTIVGSFAISPALGFLFSLGLILGYLYSGKPFYGKNHPLISTILNGLAHGMLLFIAGYFSASGKFWQGLLFSIPYFFAVTAVFVGTTLPDIPGDKKDGKITPGVLLGVRYSLWLMVTLVILTIVFSSILADWVMLGTAAICIPFYLYSAFTSNLPISIFSIKFSILLLSFAACWFFWPYALILLGLIVVTRIYYRYRFKIAYPSLT
jgi:4-hydroxybenzoate polyprenyltransferase